MNSLITHNQQISILVLLSRVKEGAFRFLTICTFCSTQKTILWNRMASSIEKLSFYTADLGRRKQLLQMWNDSRHWTNGPSRHTLFPLLGSNHKRHGTGRLHRRKRWDASLLSTDDHLIPPPISSLLTQGVPGHELGISTLAEQLEGTPISHSTFCTWILETRVIKTNLRSVSVLWIISIEIL